MMRQLFVKLFMVHGKAYRSTALAWLATLLNMNDTRTNVVTNTRPHGEDIQATCTDGEAYNVLLLSCFKLNNTVIFFRTAKALFHVYRKTPLMNHPSKGITMPKELIFLVPILLLYY